MRSGIPTTSFVPLAKDPVTRGQSTQPLVLTAYIGSTPVNRRYLWLALALSAVQFIAFKLCFPYPDFISDSYNYIESAYYHLDANLWPVAYAKFLSLIHVISPSDLFLVGVQYIFLQAALLYFFFSVKFLYRPVEPVARFLFVALICNPMFIYVSNAVLSDALFTAVSMVWLTILLWQLRAPTRMGLACQVLLLCLAFTIRYSALYYPLVAASALLLMRMPPWEKVGWMLAPALLLVPFMLFTRAETKKYTGTAQFSVFGGWQVANNALYMYGHVQVDPADLPEELRPLDTMMKKYYADAPAGFFNFADYPGTFFIKHQSSPLKQSMVRTWRAQPHTMEFVAWGKVSPLYSRYGSWLIRHHPIAFAKYYLLLNTRNYFLPFPEIFGVYNYGVDDVWESAQEWFHWPSLKVRSISGTLPGAVFYIYPVIFGILNLYFFGCLFWLSVTGKWRLLDPRFRQAVSFIFIFQLLNFGFSVLATPVVLRHIITPMTILFAFSLLLLSFTDSDQLRATGPSPQSSEDAQTGQNQGGSVLLVTC